MPQPVPAPAVLTVAEAADELGVAPGRVRALLSRGALQPAPGDGAALLAADVADLLKRGLVRAVDATAVEAAVDRALRRRLPALLEGGLAPLASEVATALADVEVSSRQLAAAEEQIRSTAGRPGRGRGPRDRARPPGAGAHRPGGGAAVAAGRPVPTPAQQRRAARLTRAGCQSAHSPLPGSWGTLPG